MRFLLEIACDNDAFQPHPRKEIGAGVMLVTIARLLRALLDGSMPLGEGDTVKLRDVNGNTVGTARFVETAP